MVGDGVAHEAGPGRAEDARVGVERVVDNGLGGGLWAEPDGESVFERRVVDASQDNDISDWALGIAAVVELDECQLLFGTEGNHAGRNATFSTMWRGYKVGVGVAGAVDEDVRDITLHAASCRVARLRRILCMMAVR